MDGFNNSFKDYSKDEFILYNNNLAQAITHINGNNPKNLTSEVMQFRFNNLMQLNNGNHLTVQMIAKDMNATEQQVRDSLARMRAKGIISDNFYGNDSDNLCFRALIAPSDWKAAQDLKATRSKK